MSDDHKSRKNTNEELATIGQRVKWARQRLGLSQDMLAKEAGVVQFTISRLEQGMGGSVHLVRIARALKCSAEWLESGIGHRTQTSAPIYRVPIVSWADVTKWRTIINSPLETTLMYQHEAPHWFSTYVPNDFMRSENPAESFEKDDLIFIDPRLEPKNGDFVFAVKDKHDDNMISPVFRRYIAEGNKKYLVCSKSGIAPIEVDDHIDIEGVVVFKRKDTAIAQRTA